MLQRHAITAQIFIEDIFLDFIFEILHTEINDKYRIGTAMKVSSITVQWDELW
jgi:hypothetical protein